MGRVHVNELVRHVGARVEIAGWIHQQRRLSKVSFLLLRDRTGIVQVVLDTLALTQDAAGLASETVLLIEGRVIASDQAVGGIEIHEPTLRVLAAAETPIPIDLRLPELKEQLPTQLDHAAISLRHPKRRAAFELAAATLHGFRATLDALGFIEIQTPKIVGSATESGANVFGIDYFGRPAYLCQSPQFYKQTMVGIFERVYETGPVFRAEPHDTPRHLAEYVSLDVEMGFIDDHFTVMRLARQVVAGMVDGIRGRAWKATELLSAEIPHVPDEIPHIHFRDAQAIIEQATGELVLGEPDLAPAHERWLSEWAQREHGTDFLFVVGYPMVKRPFYTQPDPQQPEYSNSFDLLFRGLELITGGQRLHRYEDYVAALAARDDSPDVYAAYLEAFKFGMPPHGGFAIGLERWVARILNLPNIREATLFPRDLNRLSP